MRPPLVPHDLLHLVVASDPQLAPDGRVFFVRATADEAADENRAAIAVARDGEWRAFTSGTDDRQPRLSPDGRDLAFVRGGSGGKRILVLRLDGGEARTLTPEPYASIARLAWSPDGSRLAFAGTAAHDAATAPIALDERSGARHIRRLPFKSDEEGLLDGRRRHLFVVDAAGGGAPVQVTRGDFDAGWPAFSPDGATLAFCAAIGVPEGAFTSDVFTIAADGEGEPRRLTASDGPKSAPVFSHDGREIACIGHRRGDDVSGRFDDELLVVDLATGETRSLSAGAGRSVTNGVMGDVRGTGGVEPPVWSPGDREILTLLARDGTCGVVAFARVSGDLRVVAGGERDVSAFAARHDRPEVAFVFATPVRPSCLATLPCWQIHVDANNVDQYHVDTKMAEQETVEQGKANSQKLFSEDASVIDFNQWLAERALAVPRRIRPVARDGAVLDAFLLDPRPAAEPAERPAPWVLQVHGGPHGAYGFTFVFEFQMLAGHGIGVAYGNPRGSQTYGGAYADAVSGHWGEIDVADVHAIADAAEAAAEIDPARFAIAGGSYGGFMTTWMMGHSERFATGVSMRAVNEFASEVGASDLGWFLERELEIPWGEDGRALFEASPMRAAAGIAKPMLVLHSERDYRCPIDQGEQLFTLLRRKGNVEAEFVRFAGDGHNLSRGGRPRNRILRLRAIAHWLVRHLRPHGVEPVAPGAGSLFAPLATERP